MLFFTQVCMTSSEIMGVTINDAPAFKALSSSALLQTVPAPMFKFG